MRYIILIFSFALLSACSNFDKKDLYGSWAAENLAFVFNADNTFDMQIATIKETGTFRTFGNNVELINKEGYVVFTAQNRDRALDIIQSKNPDLIISDIMLPFTGGLDIVDFVKSDPLKKNIPIVLITGMDEDVLQCTHTKADECITKPFSIEQIKTIVKKYLPVKN